MLEIMLKLTEKIYKLVAFSQSVIMRVLPRKGLKFISVPSTLCFCLLHANIYFSYGGSLASFVLIVYNLAGIVGYSSVLIFI